jgi:cyclohexa-1,5-dienecarbonyl-CoA hydratase
VSRCTLERRGRVAALTLTHPPLNILDLQALTELDELLATLEGDHELQVLMVRGAGERAFCAGVAVADHTADRIEPTLRTFHRALLRLWRLEATTLAVVHGHCLGGGLELAAACDLVVAASDSRLGVPEVRLGCYPPVAAALFPRRLGAPRALELMLTGRTIDAEEARRLGLVTRVAAPGGLATAAEALVAEVTAHSAAVTRAIKRASRAGEGLPFPEALAATERHYLEELTATADMAEGIAAFLEKRPPAWRHR